MITFTKQVKFRVTMVIGIVVLLFLYRLSPYKLEFLGYYNKIWAHRANSIDKLHSALQFYDGVELDLIYNESEDFLDVNHSLSPSIGLKFENYMNTLENEQYPYLWLDIKNLNEKTAKAILNKLVGIFEKRNYPLEKILIETRYPEVLPVFSDIGFKTSYYLPGGLTKKETTELKRNIEIIEDVLNDQPEVGISTSYKDYHIVNEYFPDRKKYIWVLVPIINLDLLTTNQILKDDTVAVVLVNYVALKGNR
ncbi:hypothetical protein [Aquimarina sp. SS2-1]|uniref:hypothetical protein n=1 Tax=Aquimarina besae TaxID=3342247 RepID=UPI00367180A3